MVVHAGECAPRDNTVALVGRASDAALASAQQELCQRKDRDRPLFASLSLAQLTSSWQASSARSHKPAERGLPNDEQKKQR